MGPDNWGVIPRKTMRCLVHLTIPVLVVTAGTAFELRAADHSNERERALIEDYIRREEFKNQA